MKNSRKTKEAGTVNRSAITRGSSNVFTDLGLPNPEEWMIKAELARQIGALVKGRTQVEIAILLGIHQPKVSGLLRGRLKDFSTERLMSFLRALGQDVEIRVRPRRVAEPLRLYASSGRASTSIAANPYAGGRIQFMNPEPQKFLIDRVPINRPAWERIHVSGGTAGATGPLGEAIYLNEAA